MAYTGLHVERITPSLRFPAWGSGLRSIKATCRPWRPLVAVIWYVLLPALLPMYLLQLLVELARSFCEGFRLCVPLLCSYDRCSRHARMSDSGPLHHQRHITVYLHRPHRYIAEAFQRRWAVQEGIYSVYNFLIVGCSEQLTSYQCLGRDCRLRSLLTLDKQMDATATCAHTAAF